jgi:hypothetical protein
MQAPTSFRQWRRPFGAEHSYVGLYRIFDSKADIIAGVRHDHLVSDFTQQTAQRGVQSAPEPRWTLNKGSLCRIAHRKKIILRMLGELSE